MEFVIPDGERKLLKEWLAEPNPATEQMLAAIEQAAPALHKEDLAREVADKSSVTFEKANDLLFAFYNLAQTAAKYSDEQDFPAALFRTVVGDLAEAATRQRFDERIRRLLASSAIQVSSKALRVMRDNPNSYCSARTLSELRPVFDKDLDPQAAVIVHQLKLVFHTGPRHEREETFVAMSLDELQDLIAVLQRAEEKHKKLVAAAQKLDLRVL